MIAFTVFFFLLCVMFARGEYYKSRPNTHCAGNDLNLGTSFKDPQECGVAASRDSRCTTEIMWSEAFGYSWGCRCCRKQNGKRDDSYYRSNTNWDIYDYYDPSDPPLLLNKCPAGKAELVVTLKTDSFPVETTWSLENLCDNSTETLRGGPYEKPHHQHIERFCVAPAQFKFKMLDGFGDGMCCDYRDPGGYSVVYNSEVVATGGEFGSSEKTTFGSPCLEVSLRLPSHNCDLFQAKKLQVFGTVEKCAEAAVAEPSCTGNEIMWSQPFHWSWGCYCCKPKPADKDYLVNKNWAIYEIRNKPIEA